MESEPESVSPCKNRVTDGHYHWILFNQVNAGGNDMFLVQWLSGQVRQLLLSSHPIQYVWFPISQMLNKVCCTVWWELIYHSGNPTGVFGAKACCGGCQEHKDVDVWREGDQVGHLQAWFSNSYCLAWEERCSGTITLCNNLWLHSWYDQIQGLVCGEDKEANGAKADSYIKLRNKLALWRFLWALSRCQICGCLFQASYRILWASKVSFETINFK